MKSHFFRRGKQHQTDEIRVTPDFHNMVKISRWNSTGFFFTEFAIPIVSNDLLGASGLGIGILFSILIIGTSFSAVIVGHIVDKFKHRKELVLIGAWGRGIAYIIMYMSILFLSYPLMVVSTFVLGFLVSFYWIPFDSLLSDKSNKENRSYAFGKRSKESGIGILIGGVFGVSIFGFSTFLFDDLYAIDYLALLVFAASNFMGGTLFNKRVDESITFDGVYGGDRGGNAEENEVTTPVTPGDDAGQGRKTDPTRIFILGISLLLFSLLLSGVNNSTAKPFIQLYMIEKIIPKPYWAMVLYVPVGVISMLIGPMLGTLADKIKPAIGIITFSSLGALETFLLINTFNPALFSIVLVADATLGGASNLILQSILSRITIGSRGKMIGLGMAMSNLGSAMGPIIGGLLRDNFSITMPFVITIFVELSLIPFYIASLKIIKPNMAEKI
ncbi:MAG: MFS transporter [Promethearchaeota archaeon]